MARYIQRDAIAQLPDSGVVADTYTNATVTVNSQGIVVSAANGSVGITTFAGLDDVDVTGLVTGDFTIWNGVDWVPHTLELASNSDVTLTGLTTDDVLAFNGVNWTNTSLSSMGFLLTSDIGVSVQAWDEELDGLSTLAHTGYVVHTGPGIFTERMIFGGDGITVNDGDGIAGDTEVVMDIFGLTTAPSIDSNADYVAIYNFDLGEIQKVLLEDFVLDSVPVITVTNIGVGAGVFKQITTGTIELRSINDVGDGITVNVSGDTNTVEITLDAGLQDIAGLTPTSDNFIVGDGANWVTETPVQVRSTLGLGSIALRDETEYLEIVGGLMQGNIDMHNLYFVTNLPTPIAGTDAANKNYVDSAIPNVVGGEGLSESTLGSTVTLSVGAGLGILVDTDNVLIDVGFTDGRYHTQTVLASTTGGSEGASLIGTDAKANLGGATTAEAVFEYLNALDILQRRFELESTGTWNLDVGAPNVIVDTVDDVEVARFPAGDDVAIYRDMHLPSWFNVGLDLVVTINLAKEVAASGVIRMELAYQNFDSPGWTAISVQSFDIGANTTRGTISWTIPSATLTSDFAPDEIMSLRLSRLSGTDVSDTYASGADFMTAYITQ